MATLVAPLVTGFSDAASGTAEFYARGTSTLSTQVYSDVNGQTAVTTHALDSRGRITRYVEEIVDVVVKNAAGAPVASWTEVVDGRTVRLESSAFTGSNPNGNGQTIASGMTTLHSGWALYRESQGADDAKVNISGTEYTIQQALATSTGVFFNVKTGYGATGNGSTDDTSAIQSAINAAITAGSGIVYFPAGTYKITSFLSVPSSTTISIHLMGASPGNTKIVQHTDAITGWLVNDSAGFSCENLRFEGNVTTLTGRILTSSKAAVFINCVFRGIAGAAANVTTDGSVKQVNTFVACAFWVENTAGQFVTGAASSGTMKAAFNSCMFHVSDVGTVTNALFNSLVAGYSNCTFEFSQTTGGCDLFGTGIYTVSASRFSPTLSGGVTVSLFATTSGTVALSGCSMDATSGVVDVFKTGIGAGSCSFAEAGSIIPWATGSITLGSPTGLPARIVIQSRETAGVTTTGFGGGNYTPNLTFRVHMIVQTAGAAPAFVNPTPVMSTAATSGGMTLTIAYRNTTGGALTPTWGNQYSGVPATAVANNNTALYEFVWVSATVMGAGAGEWICVTTNPVVAAT